MLTLRSIKHVRTSRNIKSFRSCPHATAVSMAHLDQARIAQEKEKLAARQARRLRLREEWREHLEHAAGPSRVLPPSARSPRTKMR